MSYKIHLDIFEGPLDLLLYFIKRDEINIYDIPIAKITRDYLEYLNMVSTMNLKLSGDFIAMAAMLMRIKAQMLLPRVQDQIENQEIEDPRNELIQRLLEYQEYKKVSQELQMLEKQHAGTYPCKPNWSHIEPENQSEETLKRVSLFDILNAFRQVMDRLPDENHTHDVAVEEANVVDQIDYIYSYLVKSNKCNFSDVVKPITNKIVLIVTLMAVLELMRSRQIRIYQSDVFADFIIEKHEAA